MLPDTGICAGNIARESLRLYPPTRRVRRAYRTSSGEEYEAAADIEGMHRDTYPWDSDALDCNPERWTEERCELKWQNQWFLAFGATPFRCPAKRDFDNVPSFGVAMIALLVGVLTA